MKEHTVIMAGPRGVGKTVLLAAMHRKLTIQDSEIGFFLSTDLGDGAQLRSLYAQIAGHSWPLATVIGDLSEWTFSVRVQQTDGKRYDACTFRYIDYAGGLLTGEGNFLKSDEALTAKDTYKKLCEYINEADSILGMLDGAKLIRLLKDNADNPSNATDPLAYNFVHQDLPTIMEVMNMPKHRVAAHFVISKWDLFQNEGIDLYAVRRRLHQINQFATFIKGLRSNTVRLIPVSAVGKGFAQPNPEKPTEMIINPSIEPEPYNVEMPLACVLPDRLEAIIRDLQRKREAEESRSVTVEPRKLTWWERLKGIIAEVANQVLPEHITKNRIVQEILEDLSKDVRLTQLEAKEKSEELKRKKEEALKSVRDAESAYVYMLQVFLQRQVNLDSEYQDSRL